MQISVLVAIFPCLHGRSSTCGQLHARNPKFFSGFTRPLRRINCVVRRRLPTLRNLPPSVRRSCTHRTYQTTRLLLASFRRQHGEMSSRAKLKSLLNLVVVVVVVVVSSTILRVVVPLRVRRRLLFAASAPLLPARRDTKPPFELEVRVCNARVRRPFPFFFLLLLVLVFFGVGNGATAWWWWWWWWCSRRHEHVAPSSSQSLSRRPFPVDEIDHSVPLVDYRAQFFSFRHRGIYHVRGGRPIF